MRIINATKYSDTDVDASPALNLAGRNAYIKVFGSGKWYGNSVAAVAISADSKLAVIEWQAGYIRESMKWVEDEIKNFIEQQTA